MKKISAKHKLEKVSVGVIGGSGLYDIQGLTDVKRYRIRTPFGDPSDQYLVGTLKGERIAFLPRHGRGHRILPHEINFRANIYGFKLLGVESIISLSAVGSMKEEYKPGDLVMIDQFFDHTKRRLSTFFGEGIAGHVSFAYPICPVLSKLLFDTAKKLGYSAHKGGTYICMEGPQFSSKGEAEIYRKWGVSVIGMTNMPEAKLAREAEICYATIAIITDYDCWHVSEEPVTVEAVVRNLKGGVEKAKAIITDVVDRIKSAEGECGCGSALSNAIMTDPAVFPQKTKVKLEPLIGKYFGGKK